MMTTATRAAMRPYSTAVAPDSSFANRFRVFLILFMFLYAPSGRWEPPM
jgi:hypothetical protein